MSKGSRSDQQIEIRDQQAAPPEPEAQLAESLGCLVIQIDWGKGHQKSPKHGQVRHGISSCECPVVDFCH